MNNISKFFRETSVGRFFIPFGIILVVFSIFMFVSMDNTKKYKKTEAIVSRTELYEEEYYDEDGNRIDATYTVYVKYSVDGKDYEEEYGIFSGYKENEKVTISYNPENPKEIAQPLSLIWPVSFLILGVISIFGGVFSLIKAYKKNKALKLQEKEWENGR